MTSKVIYTCTNCGACGLYDDMGETVDFCGGNRLLDGYTSVRSDPRDKLKEGWKKGKQIAERRKDYQSKITRSEGVKRK